jgi:hypothetical protein
MLDIDLKADAYLTALVYAYNCGTNDKANPNGGVQVVVGDLPTIIHRE